jgi:hypothetical protein
MLWTAMALAGPTQWEARWCSVIASFDKKHEIPIATNPDATQETNLVRLRLLKVRQLIQTLRSKMATVSRGND